MRKMIISALTAAAAAAVMGGAGLAAASTHAAVSGTEHFQMVTTSGTGSTGSVIASGVFTAPAVDHEHEASNTATFTFANGTITLKHSNGTGTQNFNPEDLPAHHQPARHLQAAERHRRLRRDQRQRHHYQLSILGIRASSGGTCVQNKPPVAFHQVINASGPVSLP